MNATTTTDIKVATTLNTFQASSSRYGNLFETWVIQELFRFNDYARSDLKFHYWRTNTGVEVDVLGWKRPFEPGLGSSRR